MMCYLVGWLGGSNGDQIVKLATYSEPPWSLTRNCKRDAPVLIFEAHDETYTKAREQLRGVYPMLMPELCKRLPFPGGES